MSYQYRWINHFVIFGPPEADYNKIASANKWTRVSSEYVRIEGSYQTDTPYLRMQTFNEC